MRTLADAARERVPVPAISAFPPPPSPPKAAREAGEGLAAQQVVHELGGRLVLDAVVGRDPVAAVDLAPGIRQLGLAAALAAALAVARRGVLVARGGGG